MSGLLRRVLAPFLLLPVFLGACGQDPAPSGPPAPAAAGVEREAASAPPAGQAPAQDPGGVLGPRVADMSVLRVKTVMDESGAAVAGVRVRLLWQSGADESEVGRSRQLTGPEGIARFEILGGTLVQSIAAEPSSLTAPEALVIKKPILPATEVDLELRLKPAATLAGIVRDLAGEPVLGAEILVWFEERWAVEGEIDKPFDVSAQSHELGSFTVGGLPQGDFLLEARKDGMVGVQRVAGKIRTGQVLDGFELVLTPSEPYFGRVVDEAGGAVAGAELVAGMVGRHAKFEPTMTSQAVYVPARQLLLRSKDDGSFEIPGRSPQEMWVVEAKHPRFQDARHRLLPGEGSGDVVMVPGFSLRGQLFDHQDRPVGRGLLRLRGEQSRAFRSGEGGGFRADGLKEDLEAAVLAYKPGFTVTLLWPFEISTGAEALRLQLQPGHMIRGTVVGAGGEPRAGIRVQVIEAAPVSEAASLDFPGTPPLAEFGLDQAQTAGDGSFSLTDLPAGELRLQLLDAGGAVLEELTVETGKDPLEIRLD